MRKTRGDETHKLAVLIFSMMLLITRRTGNRSSFQQLRRADRLSAVGELAASLARETVANRLARSKKTKVETKVHRPSVLS